MTKKRAEKTRSYAPVTMDVWEMPEFRALCERLGIDLTKSTSYLKIELLKPTEPVLISHVYEAGDSQGLPASAAELRQQTDQSFVDD